MYKIKLLFALAFYSLLTLGAVSCGEQQDENENKDPKSIAEEAYIYGLPMIMAYQIMYEYNLDKKSGQYKGPFNKITNEAQVYTPKDTAVITPNSDTPYSFIMMDLRAEPIILCVPKVDANRYYSVQLVSLYTFNFAYIGSRATGNEAGCYGVVGPNWKGALPPGVNKLFRSETEMAFAIYRTQLFNPADINNVKKIQSGYSAKTLSKFLNQPTPPPAATIYWPKIDKQMATENPFSYLAFLLKFAPAVGAATVETSLRDRFTEIGIKAGQPFDLNKLTEQQMTDLNEGIQSGVIKIKQQLENMGETENGWQVSTKGFGDRAALKGDWTVRAAAAMAGIFGNDAVEAMYPITKVDSEDQPLDGSKHNYTLTFPADGLPPVNAFWSVTMYDAKTQLLIENPINRYLINSPMLPDLKKNSDGSITLYIQKDSPGKELESNWLPAPNGPIYLVMRLYWPKNEALSGEWKPPAVIRSGS